MDRLFCHKPLNPMDLQLFFVPYTVHRKNWYFSNIDGARYQRKKIGYGTFSKILWFFIICCKTMKKLAKIRSPSRQLSARNVVEFHKQRPIRPFWRLVFFTKTAGAQLLGVQSKKDTTYHVLQWNSPQKSCSAHWSTIKLTLTKIELHLLGI